MVWLSSFKLPSSWLNRPQRDRHLLFLLTYSCLKTNKQTNYNKQPNKIKMILKKIIKKQNNNKKNSVPFQFGFEFVRSPLISVWISLVIHYYYHYDLNCNFCFLSLVLSTFSLLLFYFSCFTFAV